MDDPITVDGHEITTQVRRRVEVEMGIEDGRLEQIDDVDFLGDAVESTYECSCGQSFSNRRQAKDHLYAEGAVQDVAGQVNKEFGRFLVRNDVDDVFITQPETAAEMVRGQGEKRRILEGIIEEGQVSKKRIAEATGIPEQFLKEHLDWLLEKGLVETVDETAGQPSGVYQAVHDTVVCQPLISKPEDWEEDCSA